jgi:hypothetical protein
MSEPSAKALRRGAHTSPNAMPGRCFSAAAWGILRNHCDNLMNTLAQSIARDSSA